MSCSMIDVSNFSETCRLCLSQGTDGIMSDINILDLPAEIALHIFSYLEASQLCHSVFPVCTQWADYSDCFQLWRHLDYVLDGLQSEEDHIKVLKRAVALRRLTISHTAPLNKLIPLLLEKCEIIQKLTVAGDTVDAEIFKSIAKKYQRNVYSVTLEGMELNSEWYSAISCVAKSLKSLTLNADCCVWAMGLLAVDCSALTSLRLMSCRQTDDYRRQMQGVKRVLRLLPDLLEVLQLGAHITPNTEIVQAIGDKRKLHTLIIEDSSEILDGDLFHLLSLRSLECLQLWRAHRLTAGGLLQFFHCSHFTVLKHLDLFDCSNLNDEVLQEISIKCSGIQTLDISSCHLLTDDGIGSVFQFCSYLDTLKMSHLPQPAGGDYLINLPTLLPNLIYLDAYNCSNISTRLLASLESNKLSVMFGRLPL